MQRPLLLPLITLMMVLFASTAAAGFDCKKPPFGERLEDLDDGYFVKYREKDGVSYYNYTGPCRYELHDFTAPVIVFAFVDGRLYARITHVLGSDNQGVTAESMFDSVTRQFGEPPKVTENGDRTVMTLELKNGLKYKLKFNNRTRASRSAFYYEPLRPKTSPPDADPQ